MPNTLFQFIWAHSKRQQLILLAVTVASFPILYLTLELPKIIVNDAIPVEAWTGSGAAQTREILGFTFDQASYLIALCFFFLGLVALSGGIKMQINTQKGLLAERLLRRFRFSLISRILRFPLPYFRRTSQGELISVVTGEAEPLGGIMGDAVAQPVFQGGQMLTILAFLFVQSPWLGFASIALIPVQAYLIPLLQRRVNRLNKERAQNIRKFSERIGETVQGVEDLRAHNGSKFILSDFSSRLGVLFEIRRNIYQTKFFMKFLNNFINQVTPFFFFLFGGSLVISGDLTLGALVAALASYKDLTAPWKELLAYYNQSQDMSIRYQTIMERFQPIGLLDNRLTDDDPKEWPRLTGDVVLDKVVVQDVDGAAIIQGLSLAAPAGSSIAIKIQGAEARRAVAQVLSRTVLPASGTIKVGEIDTATLHQSASAMRIGHVGGSTHLFNASVQDNVNLALLNQIKADQADLSRLSTDAQADFIEAIRAGNAPPLDEEPSVSPELAGFKDARAVEAWRLEIIKALGAEDQLFRIKLNHLIDPAKHPQLAQKIVALRPTVLRKIDALDLTRAVSRFDRQNFDPSLTIIENLLFATRRSSAAIEDLVDRISHDGKLTAVIRDLGVEATLFGLAEELLLILTRTFQGVESDHPLFRRVTGLDQAGFKRLFDLQEKLNRQPKAALNESERAMLLELLVRLSPADVSLSIHADMQTRILAARRNADDPLPSELSAYFEPIGSERYLSNLSMLENALFGRPVELSATSKQKVVEIVESCFEDSGMKGEIALLIGEIQAGVGGANLPPVAHERIAFTRAAIRKPDILVLEQAFSSYTPESRDQVRADIRKLLPNATIFHIEEHIRRLELFDFVFEIIDGKLAGDEEVSDELGSEPASNPDTFSDLKEKRRILAQAPLFAELSRKQQRMLAYTARYLTAEPGEYIFSAGDSADGAYLFVEGTAELHWPKSERGLRLLLNRARQLDPSTTDTQINVEAFQRDTAAAETPITVVTKGRLIGDLSVISGSARPLDLIATERVTALKVGSAELLEVIEDDPKVASSLLRTVGGHLENAAMRLFMLRLQGETDKAPKG